MKSASIALVVACSVVVSVIASAIPDCPTSKEDVIYELERTFHQNDDVKKCIADMNGITPTILHMAVQPFVEVVRFVLDENEFTGGDEHEAPEAGSKQYEMMARVFNVKDALLHGELKLLTDENGIDIDAIRQAMQTGARSSQHGDGPDDAGPSASITERVVQWLGNFGGYNPTQDTNKACDNAKASLNTRVQDFIEHCVVFEMNHGNYNNIN